MVQPISQVNLEQCILSWQFDDLKHMCLDLRGFSVICTSPGTMSMYAAEAFSTIRDLVPHVIPNTEPNGGFIPNGQ